MLQGGRRVCQSEAYIVCRLPGSNARSIAPVFSSLNKMHRQFFPPSLERKTPRSVFGPYAWPRAATKTLLGSLGSIRIRPICRESVRPMCVHVFPPSVDLYMPFPVEIEERMSASPEPT